MEKSEPHCCACEECSENPNGCPEGYVNIIKSGLDRQRRLYLVGADGSIKLFRGGGKPDLDQKIWDEIAALLANNHSHDKN
jgi:hypothetical protein